MRAEKQRHKGTRYLAQRLAGERGIVVVVVMMFCLIFLVLGLALYWLTTSQINATETERKDVKSFNVAEAGVDAGMLALKLDWPFNADDHVTIDEALIKTALQDDNETLYDPDRSDSSEFLTVTVYDNSVYDESAAGDYQTVTEPPADVADRVAWDANKDGMMFVDATSNVQDDRHRILLLAERQTWNLYFPVGTALRANEVDSNGQGYGIEIEVAGPGMSEVYYDVNDATGKGIDEGPGVTTYPGGPIPFDSIITEALIKALESIAIQNGTYFEDSATVDADVEAEDFLTSGDAGGSVVYVKSNSAIDIASNVQIGTEDFPVVCILDAPDGADNSWDMGGSAEFYGILVVLGDGTLKGTCSTHGAMYVEGTLLNDGNGVDEELQYNYTVISNINRVYTLSVNIVANSWEEYVVEAEE